MECAVSAAEQEAVRHMYGDFRQKSRGSQKRQREEEDDERGARQYAHPEHQEVVEIQSRAEEDDAQRQDSLDHEVRAGSELPGYGHRDCEG